LPATPGRLHAARSDAGSTALRITFIQPDGIPVTLDGAGHATAMHLALRHQVRGLPAECGGQCICVTCMVDPEPGWAARLPPAGEDEMDMLSDTLGTVPPGRRLSCQIRLEPGLDGLVLRIPPGQGPTGPAPG
jgi:2Fe-2S ferredoxin